MIRQTYHHGDLKHALLEAGLARARAGGPGAVALREVARECGVTVPAVYRHFTDRGDFLRALAMASQARLARRIEAAAQGLAARDLLRAVGREYIGFAIAEPGWFATAFEVPENLTNAMSADAAGEGGATPFGLLVRALDEMVAAGEIAPEHRPHREVACWSMVHGYAVLVTAGPLRELEPASVEALAQLVVEVAIDGVSSVR